MTASQTDTVKLGNCFLVIVTERMYLMIAEDSCRIGPKEFWPTLHLHLQMIVTKTGHRATHVAYF